MYSCEMQKLKICAKEHFLQLYSYRMPGCIFQSVLAFLKLSMYFKPLALILKLPLALPVQYFLAGNQNAIVATL